jgi:hypothetical protein
MRQTHRSVTGISSFKSLLHGGFCVLIKICDFVLLFVLLLKYITEGESERESGN